jgi:hypothetical protein
MMSLSKASNSNMDFDRIMGRFELSDFYIIQTLALISSTEISRACNLPTTLVFYRAGIPQQLLYEWFMSCRLPLPQQND